MGSQQRTEGLCWTDWAPSRGLRIMLGRACCSLKLGCKSEREARRGVGRSVERERENKSCTMFDAACTTVERRPTLTY